MLRGLITRVACQGAFADVIHVIHNSRKPDPMLIGCTLRRVIRRLRIPRTVNDTDATTLDSKRPQAFPGVQYPNFIATAHARSGELGRASR